MCHNERKVPGEWQVRQTTPAIESLLLSGSFLIKFSPVSLTILEEVTARPWFESLQGCAVFFLFFYFFIFFYCFVWSSCQFFYLCRRKGREFDKTPAIFQVSGRKHSAKKTATTARARVSCRSITAILVTEEKQKQYVHRYQCYSRPLSGPNYKSRQKFTVGPSQGQYSVCASARACVCVCVCVCVLGLSTLGAGLKGGFEPELSCTENQGLGRALKNSVQN